jgi:hypothetical protein
MRKAMIARALLKKPDILLLIQFSMPSIAKAV